jgi:RHS repeat-associated protein
VITQHYEVKRDRDLVYDLNGNLVNDGQRTYTWDAANRLVKVSVLDPTTGLSSRTSEFTYDGLWRRVRMLEKDGVVTTADRRFIWVGAEIKEERNAANQVQKRFYSQGVQVVSGAEAGSYFYQRDHLGSVRSVLNGAGAIVASYDYDLWGKRSKVSGSFDADFGFTGHFEHGKSGLVLTWFRAYEPGLGRWVSRDPLEEIGGFNLYAYVSNGPTVFFDPFGLCKQEFRSPEILRLMVPGQVSWDRFVTEAYYGNDNANRAAALSQYIADVSGTLAMGGMLKAIQSAGPLATYFGPSGPVFGSGRAGQVGLYNTGYIRFGWSPHQNNYNLSLRIGAQHFDVPFCTVPR